MSGVLRFDASLAAGLGIPNLLAGTFMERLGPRPEVMTVFGVVDDVAGFPGLGPWETRGGERVIPDRRAIPPFPGGAGRRVAWLCPGDRTTSPGGGVWSGRKTRGNPSSSRRCNP